MSARLLPAVPSLILIGMSVAVARAISAPPAEASPPVTAAADPRPPHAVIEHGGQRFELANSTSNASVKTDEYTVAGETLATWTQLVTVQRLRVAAPADTNAFVGYFRQRVADDGASLEVVSQGKTAAVFAVRFPKSDKCEEQVMICLAFNDPGDAARLDIVQYAIKPGCKPVDVTTSLIKSWRDKFVAQAETLGRRSASG